MKTKTITPFQFDFEIPTANTTLARIPVPGVYDDLPQAHVTVMPSRDPRVRLSEIPIESKPIEQIAVTMRLRADGMLHPCTCNGTGEDGCIVDDTLARANPRAGFPSFSPSFGLGGGGHE